MHKVLSSTADFYSAIPMFRVCKIFLLKEMNKTYFLTFYVSWKKCIMVSIKILRSTTAFNIDDNKTVILNYNNVSQYYCCYYNFNQRNAALVSKRAFFQKPQMVFFLQPCSSKCWWVQKWHLVGWLSSVVHMREVGCLFCDLMFLTA